MTETAEQAGRRAAQQVCDKIRALADDHTERWGEDRVEQDRAGIRPLRSL